MTPIERDCETNKEEGDDIKRNFLKTEQHLSLTGYASLPVTMSCRQLPLDHHEDNGSKQIEDEKRKGEGEGSTLMVVMVE